MIKIALESDSCLFIQRFDDPMETEWKLKKEFLFDIIECLTDKTVKEWEYFYRNSEAFTPEEDDDE